MKSILLATSCLFIVSNCLSQNFTNASLELWSSPLICETNVPPDGWSNYSNVGIGPDEANFTLCPTTIPTHAANGNLYARCVAGNPSTGEGMFQNVSGFIAGEGYNIEYSFCGSNLYGGTGDCIWHLFIDDIDVNQSIIFSSSDTTWHRNSFTFTATAATHKIGVRAYTPTYNGGGSAAIDSFSISPGEVTDIDNQSVTAQITITPNPFADNLTIQNFDNQISTTVVLFDVVGKAILSREFSGTLTIDTEMLTDGVYFYQLKNKNNIFRVGKLVKE